MSVLGAVVRTKPVSVPGLALRLGSMRGVDLALNPGDGRMVIVIEDVAGPVGADEPASAAEVLTHIARWPEVLSTSLVYEYSGPDAPAPATAQGTDFRSWRGAA